MVNAFNMNFLEEDLDENVHIIEDEDDLEAKNTDDETLLSDVEDIDEELDDWVPDEEGYDDQLDYEGRRLAHNGCVAHSLQLVINDSLKESSASDFLKYIRSCMVFFKKSTKWSDKLKELTTLDVVVSAQTRWNGMLIMLDRFTQVIGCFDFKLV